MENTDTRQKINIPIMSELAAQNKKPEYLFWVGCAGSYDDRYKKVARDMARILHHLKIDFAILGHEEKCTGDPAKRAGNEFVFQMQAMGNIEVLNAYEVKKIITICPHCYNIFKNEYPELGGKYEVYHYTQLFEKWNKEGILKVDNGIWKDKKITFHDPCYLARGNKITNEPRTVLQELSNSTVEMKRNKLNALCCGAGGAQMFKEAEKGDKEIYTERTEEALETGAQIVATSCPFCMTMLSDGIKYKNMEEEVSNYDIIELVAKAII